MLYSLDRSRSLGADAIENIEDETRFNRTTNLLLAVSVFYVTFGTFVMALVVTQSLSKDFKF